jgi:N-acetylglucosaminyldiphosphoundecaprenol N-acetyl-beta-D-mannosaminyltransferase
MRQRVTLGGTAVDLCGEEDFLAVLRDHLTGPRPAAPLAVSSANLDHIHHFGTGGRNRALLAAPGPRWLVLLDGVPLVRRAAALTGRDWPQLAGSDLLPAVLATADDAGARVGFLGGTPAMQQRLAAVLAEAYPSLKVAGMWAPDRAGLMAPALADTIRAADADLLVVGLGKPRQEDWISRYAGASGARVLLGFGAAADFLAGEVSRAPRWLRRAGGEWLYRLVREPRRLFRRYCLEGPPAMWRLWRDSRP